MDCSFRGNQQFMGIYASKLTEPTTSYLTVTDIDNAAANSNTATVKVY